MFLSASLRMSAEILFWPAWLSLFIFLSFVFTMPAVSCSLLQLSCQATVQKFLLLAGLRIILFDYLKHIVVWLWFVQYGYYLNCRFVGCLWRLRLGDVAAFENQPVTAAKFMNKSSLFILLLGVIRRLELKPISEQKDGDLFVCQHSSKHLCYQCKF